MVELPEGKMKSREGTVVDADNLIADMVSTAREMSDELGKLDGCTAQEADAIASMVGLGALKYFILKVDPKKTMLFDPRESIDFNGNTGPFIQYTHARIKSVLRKAAERGIVPASELHSSALSIEEVGLIKMLADYPGAVAQAGATFSRSVIANYAYELAKAYNSYYHDFPILREADAQKQTMRLTLSETVARVIASAMAQEPELIILDEPTAGQDFRHYTDIMEFLRGLNAKGVTVVMITHDMHLMLEYTPRALAFCDGRLIADRSAAAILCDPALIEQAALKETSLYTLANRCGIAPAEDFVERFIHEDREVRTHGC